jgi:FtsZ-interacting cell division protein ZipA
LIAPTAIAMVLFLSEGIWLRRKTQSENNRKKRNPTKTQANAPNVAGEVHE